jgi:hypothetical protein
MNERREVPVCWEASWYIRVSVLSGDQLLAENRIHVLENIWLLCIRLT